MRRVRIRVPRIRPHFTLHEVLVHVATTIFFADMLAAVWQGFAQVWEAHARVGVAMAALLACLADYVPKDEPKKEAEDDRTDRV